MILLLLLSCISRVWLCDPIDGSPPGSSVPGILLEWVAMSFSNAWKWKVKVKSVNICIYCKIIITISLFNICPHISVQFSHSVISDSLQPHGLQHARLPCPSPTPGAYSNSCPLSWWCHPAISSSVVPSPPASNLSQHQGLFRWDSSSHQVAKVLEFQLQHQPLQWIFRTDFL